MISKATLLWILLLLPAALNADWVDKLATAIEGYDKLTSLDQSHSSLVADDAARHGLPGHWQVYWLDEPLNAVRVLFPYGLIVEIAAQRIYFIQKPL